MSEPMTVEAAAESVGVELRGHDGQPFCCGARMNVRGGIVGVDYARCETCGTLLTRVDSPHTNGGYVLSAEAWDALGDAVWVAFPGDSLIALSVGESSDEEPAS